MSNIKSLLEKYRPTLGVVISFNSENSYALRFGNYNLVDSQIIQKKLNLLSQYADIDFIYINTNKTTVKTVQTIAQVYAKYAKTLIFNAQEYACVTNNDTVILCDSELAKRLVSEQKNYKYAVSSILNCIINLSLTQKLHCILLKDSEKVYSANSLNDAITESQLYNEADTILTSHLVREDDIKIKPVYLKINTNQDIIGDLDLANVRARLDALAEAEVSFIPIIDVNSVSSERLESYFELAASKSKDNSILLYKDSLSIEDLFNYKAVYKYGNLGFLYSLDEKQAKYFSVKRFKDIQYAETIRSKDNYPIVLRLNDSRKFCIECTGDLKKFEANALSNRIDKINSIFK